MTVALGATVLCGTALADTVGSTEPAGSATTVVTAPTTDPASPTPATDPASASTDPASPTPAASAAPTPAASAAPTTTASAAPTTTASAAPTRTAQATSTPPAINPATHNPVGTMQLAVYGRTLVFRGRASDPDAKYVRLAVMIDGGIRQRLLINSGGTYFSEIQLRFWGRHTASVVVYNYGMGTITAQTLGTRQLNLINPATRNPVAWATIATQGQTLTVRGYATDPDRPHSGIFIRVYRGTTLIKIGVQTNSVTHRFATSMQLRYGISTIRVVAMNVGLGTRNTTAALRVVNVLRPWTSQYVGNPRIAADMLWRYGWGSAQMPPLLKLWNKESGWRVNAYNPSGAYGIPQALPGGKMASAGSDWRTNPRTQIAWGLGYIKSVYGSPAAAWAHSVAYNWY